MKIPAKGFTHGGKFHADDVFATALLMIVRPDIKVTRGFVVPDGFDGIVYDVAAVCLTTTRNRAKAAPTACPMRLWPAVARVGCPAGGCPPGPPAG